MLIKFFATGTGSGKGPTDYCCNIEVPTIVSTLDPSSKRLKSRILRNDNGKPVLKTRRPPPEILAGDREITRALIDSLDFRWRYSSGVVAFAPEDRPTEEQQNRLMAEFEELAFAGMSRERYDILWVRHTHQGVPELHFVIPRVDLVSGKSYNPAPPGWERSFAPLRDAWNHENGWARPDDPERARAIQPGHGALQRAENLRAQLIDTTDPKTMITEYLQACIDVGWIKERNDILATLQELGMTINRQGVDYISVRPTANAKPIRLKGAIYQATFNAADYLKTHSGNTALQAGELDKTLSPANAEHAAIARRNLAREVQKRAHYNARRYPQPLTADATVADKHPNMALSMPGSRIAVVSLVESTVENLENQPLDLPLPWQVTQPTSEPRHSQKQPQKQFVTAAEDDAERVTNNQRNRHRWWHRLKDEYDRIGKTLTTSLTAIIAAIQRGYDRACQAEQLAQRASERLEAASRQLEQADRALTQLTATDQNRLEVSLPLNSSRVR